MTLQVAEILKDRPSWYRDCRCLEVATVVPTGNGGTIELIYMQVCNPLSNLGLKKMSICLFIQKINKNFYLDLYKRSVLRKRCYMMFE